MRLEPLDRPPPEPILDPGPGSNGVGGVLLRFIHDLVTMNRRASAPRIVRVAWKLILHFRGAGYYVSWWGLVEGASPFSVEKLVVVTVHVVVKVEDFTIESATEPLHADLVVQLDQEDGEGVEKVTSAVTLSEFVGREPLPVNGGEDCPVELLVGGTAIVRSVVSDTGLLLLEAPAVSWAWVDWPVGSPKVEMGEPSDEIRLELVQTPDKELKVPPIGDPERDERPVNVVRVFPGVVDKLDMLRIDARFVSVGLGTVPGVALSLVVEPSIVIVEVSKAVRVLAIVRETGPLDGEDPVALDRVIKIGELKTGDEPVASLAEDSIGLDRVMKVGELKAGGELLSSLAEGLESEDPLVFMGDPTLLGQLPGIETVIVTPEVAGDVSPLLGLSEILEPLLHVARQDVVDNVMRLGSGVPVTIWLSVLGDVNI
ncbi:unnamed protein product [Clonostachys byssicola]|uniref:Uncharacterized protein n=1 Tax=Clonostachys byssicola TaxID=160290 RepID=A0A9N9Y484_9HYPO|nr:unnamed protein product [Clonostachys byssicola]